MYRYILYNVYITYFQHLFALEQRSDLIKAIQEAAAAYVGIAIKLRKDPITFDQYQTHRLGKYRSVA